MQATGENAGSGFIAAGPREGKSLWVLGDHYTFKVTGKQTGGSYGTVEIECYAGHGAPPHVHHREDESFYILDGELAFMCGDRNFAAKAGTFLHVPRGMLHAFTNNSGKAVRMLVSYSPAGFEDFFERVGQVAAPGSTPPPTGPEDMARIMAAAPDFGLEIRLPQS